jgi:polyribonucleotide nucleotidyltransferase
VSDTSQEATYRRYVEHGPDSLPEKVTRAALDFRDREPAKAFEVRARLQREKREAGEKEDLRDAWLKDGGSVQEFEEVHKKVTAEAKAERLRRMDEEVKETFARDIVRGF